MPGLGTSQKVSIGAHRFAPVSRPELFDRRPSALKAQDKDPGRVGIRSRQMDESPFFKCPDWCPGAWCEKGLSRAWWSWAIKEHCCDSEAVMACSPISTVAFRDPQKQCEIKLAKISHTWSSCQVLGANCVGRLPTMRAQARRVLQKKYRHLLMGNSELSFHLCGMDKQQETMTTMTCSKHTHTHHLLLIDTTIFASNRCLTSSNRCLY